MPTQNDPCYKTEDLDGNSVVINHENRNGHCVYCETKMEGRRK